MDLADHEVGDRLVILQRAAGLLNVSVDELINIGRPSSSHTDTGASAGRRRESQSRHIHDEPFHGHHFPAESPAHTNEGVSWDFGQTSLDASGLGLVHFDFQQHHAQPALQTHSFSGVHAAGPTGIPATEVILLNPQSAGFFDCDMDFGGQFHGFGAGNDSDPFNSSEGDGFVQLTPKGTNSDADSETTVRDEELDDVDEVAQWHVVPSSQSISSSSDKQSRSSISRHYQTIVPKPGAVKSFVGRSSSSSSAQKVRKRRAPYSNAKRSDTNLTRSLNACVRCRIQRNRCVPDPVNPRGPCKPCQLKKTRLSRLPCLRYKLSDSTLFRTGLDFMPFYKLHPMTGPHYGDFYIEKQWTDTPSRFLRLGQDRGSFFRLELRQFIPPIEPTAVDLKGRSMYVVPLAIADLEGAVVALNEYIDGSIGNYLESVLDGTDGIVWDIFHAAYRAALFPVPNRLLQKTLRLWVVCRFIESRWRCWADEEDQEDITGSFPEDPFYKDLTSLPPYVDYQFASIIIYRVLMPLREEILRELERMVEKHKPDEWYITFLTTFILLQNYELQMQFQQQFAARRNSPTVYMDMALVRATNSGAKTILAHFHYCCKGQQPFKKEFDWEAPKIRRMARLDSEQSKFMSAYRDRVIQKAASFQRLNHGHSYHDMYWYTSQLFDPDWKPRDTLEHSPPAQRTN